MAGFNPNLPSWTTPLWWYQYDPVTDSWSQQLPITGQVYTPKRGQDDQLGGLLYFEYPKESDLLKDTYDYEAAGKADVLAIEYPTASGKYRGFTVRDINPRWLRFENEHLIASLTRLTPTEFDEVTGGVPPSQFLAIGNWTEITQSDDLDLKAWSTLALAESECVFDDALLETEIIQLHGLEITLPADAIIQGLLQHFECVAFDASTALERLDSNFGLQASLADFLGQDNDPTGSWSDVAYTPRNKGGPTSLWGGGWTVAKLTTNQSWGYAGCKIQTVLASGTIARIKVGELWVYYTIPT